MGYVIYKLFICRHIDNEYIERYHRKGRESYLIYVNCVEKEQKK